MAVDKPTISIDADLRAEADRLAGEEGLTFSAFVSRAIADDVKRRRAAQQLLSVIGTWEQEHGEIRSDEVDGASTELGLPVTPRKARLRSTSVAARTIGERPSTRRQRAK